VWDSSPCPRQSTGTAKYNNFTTLCRVGRTGHPVDNFGSLPGNDAPLTLAEIINLRLSARLVGLSACETGIFALRHSPDEYIGLPTGFLQGGAAGVISSL